jgi:Arc/MetJ-type ribon-helix-helix transcriptional regulator
VLFRPRPAYALRAVKDYELGLEPSNGAIKDIVVARGICIRMLRGLGMGSRVVPVRLDDDLLRLVKELVELGVYGSRSEALRDLIRIGAERMKWARMVAGAVNKLFELEREEGDIPLKLNGALRQLLAERGSF